MSTSAIAVIGAQYGDEGKGLVTDFLAAQREPGDTVVVRINGGAQAGHTVQLPNDGPRHVHHHFGSGSLEGYGAGGEGSHEGSGQGRGGHRGRDALSKEGTPAWNRVVGLNYPDDGSACICCWAGERALVLTAGR